MACDHVFHHKCIITWIIGSDKHSCPVCRQSTTVTKLIIGIKLRYKAITKVSHLTALVDSLMRCDGYEPPYNLSTIRSLFEQDKWPSIQKHICFRVLGMKFAPLCVFGSLSREQITVRIEAFIKAVECMNLVMDSCRVYQDKAKIIYKFVKPRSLAIVEQQTSVAYGLADYILRTEYNRKPPYTENEVKNVLRKVGIDWTLLSLPYTFFDHHRLLSDGVFETLMGMSRVQPVRDANGIITELKMDIETGNFYLNTTTFGIQATIL